MKKTILPIAALCLFVGVSSTSFAQSPTVIVAGAGSTAVNGTYVSTGSHNSKPLFLMIPDGPFVLGWGVFAGDQRWEIYDNAGTVLYINTNDTPLPPSTGWSGVFSAGIVPAPTLSGDISTRILYVKSNAAGLSNGTSWTNAYTSFQSALTAAVSGDQIWVAKGTYKPSSYYDLTNTSRYYHFRMKPGAAIYGGFAGTETLASQRITYGGGETNETVLSGDLNDNGKDDNDCYHVFYHPNGLGLTGSAILDGFTVKGGNANGVSPHKTGGGMSNISNSPSINNCIFTSNEASDADGGGGMFNSGSSSSITNCTFSSNSAGYYGGGMYNSNSSLSISNCAFSSNSATAGGGMYISACSPTLINCTFSLNSATYGGGVCNHSSSPTLTNCTFTSNSASEGGGMDNGWSSSPIVTNCTFASNSAYDGGGMYNGSPSFPTSPTLNNCIIWGNEATHDGDEFYIDGGTTTLNYSCYANTPTEDVSIASGTLTVTNNNITTDPKFVGSSVNSAHPYSIPGISPCVDVGNDSYNSQDYDIRGAGYSRKLDKSSGAAGTIDMGAYEYKIGVDALPVELTSFTASNGKNGVSLQWQSVTETNNFGYEVERKMSASWEKAGFVEGHGTTNAPQSYSFIDKPAIGKIAYRLKQIDRDGKFEYSKEIEIIAIGAPQGFALAQNYPNPFNPVTVINYQLAQSGVVSITVFDVLGREAMSLVNEMKQAGSYCVSFDASKLPSGLYYYRLRSRELVATKSMVLLK